MKPEVMLKKLRQRKFALEHQLQQLEALDLSDRGIDWLDEWAYLQTQIDRVNRRIAEQEELCQAKSH